MIITPAQAIIPTYQLESRTLLRLERYGRTCYKSEDDLSGSGDEFVRKLLKRGHESVIEHEKITIFLVTNRGVSHEVVRHRVGSYSQESTRYCNYAKEKFGRHVTFLQPNALFEEEDQRGLVKWGQSMAMAEEEYFWYLDNGYAPQIARDALPNATKTEMVITYNLREWRWFFLKRCAKEAHPQMQQVALSLLAIFSNYLPSLFDDVPFDASFISPKYAEIYEADDLLEIKSGDLRHRLLPAP